MIDITKCSGIKCPKKHKCYRYTSRADSNYQSFGNFKYDFTKRGCDHFMFLKRLSDNVYILHGNKTDEDI